MVALPLAAHIVEPRQQLRTDTALQLVEFILAEHVPQAVALQSIATIARSIQKFNEPDRYVDKLLKKVAVVSTDPAAVATALDVANALRNWSVKPLMVTRYVEPAAFVRDQRVPFYTISELEQVLKDGA